MDSPSQSFDQLLADLAHPNPNIRDNACSLMAEHFADQALPQLISLLHDPDPTVYRTAVKGLGILGHQSVPHLLELFETSDNGTVKACCIKALVQVSVNFPTQAFPAQTMDVLEKALDEANPVVAQSALMTLGHLSKQDSEKERVIPLLIKACERDNIAHVQGALMALAELDAPLVNDCLEKLASDMSKDSLVREMAQASLERRESLNLG
ncbi:HEAT repeat domain-containing protein [Synechococcus sp. MIT S9451]|uniref:HEAT repeat domain-containing protein n=1 Tax=Synechococcus sp. MIT S9451 TaxID=3082543 RepID=UPI0039B6279C